MRHPIGHWERVPSHVLGQSHPTSVLASWSECLGTSFVSSVRTGRDSSASRSMKNQDSLILWDLKPWGYHLLCQGRAIPLASRVLIGTSWDIPCPKFRDKTGRWRIPFYGKTRTTLSIHIYITYCLSPSKVNRELQRKEIRSSYWILIHKNKGDIRRHT